MFNIVYGDFNSHLYNNDKIIQEIIDLFNGQPFAWWIPPSSKNQSLTDLLRLKGFICEADAIAMI